MLDVLSGDYEAAMARCEDLAAGRPGWRGPFPVGAARDTLPRLMACGEDRRSGRYLDRRRSRLVEISPLAAVHAYDGFWMLAETAIAIWEAADTGAPLPAGGDATAAADGVIRPLLGQGRTTPIARPMAFVVRGHQARRAGNTRKAIRLGARRSSWPADSRCHTR